MNDEKVADRLKSIKTFASTGGHSKAFFVDSYPLRGHIYLPGQALGIFVTSLRPNIRTPSPLLRNRSIPAGSLQDTLDKLHTDAAVGSANL